MGVCITFHNFLKLIYARVHLSTCLTRLKFNSPTSLSSSSRHTMMTGVRTPNAYTLLFKKNNSNIFLFIFSWGLDWVSEQCILTIGIRSASRVLISAVVNTWVIVDGWSMCSAYYNRNGHSLEILGSTSLWSIVEWHTLDLMYCVNGFPVELSVWLFVQALHRLHDPMDWPGLSRCPILDDWWSYCKEVSVPPSVSLVMLLWE